MNSPIEAARPASGAELLQHSASLGATAVAPVPKSGSPVSAIKTMSVVMAAHNEHEYMKRTLQSIYDRTPSSILKEIIVVDDGSSPPLAVNMADFPEVKVIRHEERRGLIKSKTEGGNAAVGDMIMFLDAHVKPEVGWADPILRHINTNYKRVVVPLIPILNPDTWEPNNNAVGTKMMFDWSLMFNWFEDFNDLVPCMSGGLFAISRQWWHESGEYDYDMMMWGAENIEQSIRIWLCGGEIYVARDSRVAHVFRSKFPYVVNNTQIYINKVRTVETWFDEYKSYYYEADPVAKTFIKSMGSIAERQAIKEKLQCKPFKWYVEKFREVFVERHMLPEEVFLIQDTVRKLCLQSAEDGVHVEEAVCDEHNHNQKWTSASGGAGLRNAGVNKCLDANAGLRDKEGSVLFMYGCYGKNPQQQWDIANGEVRWSGGYCVNSKSDGQLTLKKCGQFMAARGPFIKYKAKVAPV